MNRQQIGALLTSLCTATLVAASAHAETAATTAKAAAPGNNEHQCQNNNCKGHGECTGYGNSNCGGMNDCKGKGWVSAKTEAECGARKGLWHGAKAAADVPPAAAPTDAGKPAGKKAPKTKKGI